MEIDLCSRCKFYTGELTCLAFPDGIPKEVLLGENDHSEPIDGQDGKFIFIDIENESVDILDFITVK